MAAGEKPGPPVVKASEIKEFMFELRQIARSLLASEREVCTVSTDALINTAYLRNTVRKGRWTDVTWDNRQFFFADMVRAMRRSLIDRFRRGQALKRPRLDFFDPADMPIDFQRDLETKPELLQVLDEAFEALEKSKSDLAQIIEYHYYLGLTTHEVGEMLSISEKTVDRALKKARVLLAEKMMAITQESED